jgi:hypothetical protein
MEVNINNVINNKGPGSPSSSGGSGSSGGGKSSGATAGNSGNSNNWGDDVSDNSGKKDNIIIEAEPDVKV